MKPKTRKLDSSESRQYSKEEIALARLRCKHSPLELYTRIETAALFRVNTRTIDAWRQRGLLPATVISRTVFFSKEAIERTILEATEKPKRK